MTTIDNAIPSTNLIPEQEEKQELPRVGGLSVTIPTQPLGQISRDSSVSIRDLSSDEDSKLKDLGDGSVSSLGESSNEQEVISESVHANQDGDNEEGAFSHTNPLAKQAIFASKFASILDLVRANNQTTANITENSQALADQYTDSSDSESFECNNPNRRFATLCRTGTAVTGRPEASDLEANTARPAGEGDAVPSMGMRQSLVVGGRADVEGAVAGNFDDISLDDDVENPSPRIVPLEERVDAINGPSNQRISLNDTIIPDHQIGERQYGMTDEEQQSAESRSKMCGYILGAGGCASGIFVGAKLDNIFVGFVATIALGGFAYALPRVLEMGDYLSRLHLPRQNTVNIGNVSGYYDPQQDRTGNEVQVTESQALPL